MNPVGDHPPEPSAEQCPAHARFVWAGHRCLALWYPQMGGYVGKAVAVPVDDGCLDVWVWHDEAFPFSDTGGPETVTPALIHHCDPGQFLDFGAQLTAFQEEEA